MHNLILDTDSYKASHYLQYPPGTVGLFNYLESRGGEYKETVFFGLQYLLYKYLNKPIEFSDVDEAAVFFKKHGLPFNRDGWDLIASEHDGLIPLRIKAVDEGTVVPVGFPLLSCESTDPRLPWVVGWFETMLMRLWYPITVSTVSYHLKQMILESLIETSDDPHNQIPFKLHDFGSRGVSSYESAAIGGAAHLVNFMGSDTVPGILLANEYYEADMAGFSIPAAEHSTITSWGRENEEQAYENMLTQFAKPGSLVAIVSDSYDIFHAVNRIWGESLRQKVIDSGATVVIRPDSGEPVTMVNQLLFALESRFGSKVNSKGYRVLNHVRIIQGDGVNPYTISRILLSAKLAGFSTENLAFGMGGALLQKVDRDTQKFAYKCSSIRIQNCGGDEAGTDRDVFKDPVTDPGKRSKAGRIGTAFADGKFQVVPDNDPSNILKVRYENGQLFNTTTLAEIRERAK